MGGGPNICALLVGVAAFARWTLCRSNVSRRTGWLNLLGGLGVLALFFSIVSPDDDAFQQELIRPASPSLKVSAQTKVAPRRSLADLSIDVFAAAEDPVLALRTGRLAIMDQPLDVLTHFQAPISIHSPPIAS
jgi:hypothetical protein